MRDRLHLLVPFSQRGFGQAEKLLANANVDRRLIVAPPLRAAIEIVVICDVGERRLRAF